MIKRVLVEATVRKYGLPDWTRPYIDDYLKGSDVDALKYAVSFINVGRRKGSVGKEGVMLPNGKQFKKEQIAHMLSVFYYGEDRISKVSELWATTKSDHVQEHARHFRAMSGIEEKRARAIKNLIEGLGYRLEKPEKELSSVFDYIENLSDWNERLLAKKILLNYSYAQSIGLVFYKVFYPVSPEFMRSFGKTFNNRQQEEVEGERMAEAALRDGGIDRERAIVITRELLELVVRSINAEMKSARKAGVQRELELLRNIALAYPLYRLRDLGMDIDVKSEIARIRRAAA